MLRPFTFKSPTIFRDIKNSFLRRLPNFLFNYTNDFTQPLLGSKELNDLQLRVSAISEKNKHTRDTAEQRMGDVRSTYRGYGLDYEESRNYQTGDEPRYMNWKLSARTGELYMKVFREERRPGIFILLDRRKSMVFGTRTRLKVTQAARAAACITFSAQQAHSSISAVILETAKTDPILIKETNDKQAAAEVIHAACTPCPPVEEINNTTHQLAQHKTDHALNMLLETVIPGSTIYLIGDFIGWGKQQRSKLMKLSACNDVNAIHIVDPAEKQLPNVGNLRFRSEETQQDITIDTTNHITNRAYHNAANNHFLTLKSMFDELRITHKEIYTTCEPIELAIL